jgi:hypothetical protein
METLIHKPECLPSNIDANGFPILSPRLYRTYNIGLPESNTTYGVVNHLNSLSYVDDVVEIQTGKIAVKACISDRYSVVLLDKLFREGVHTMSEKIWKVSKYIDAMTSVAADYILYETIKYYHITDFLGDHAVKNYIVYLIDIVPT